MAKDKDKKTKRRGSQAFRFEQTEETLLQNETICNLYNNKNYVAPSPSQLESITEEEKQDKDKRVRRGEGVSGSPAVKKSKRFLEPYKFWRVDNTDKNKKRKAMVTKMWRGRKKPKPSPLTEESELYLEQLIELKDESFDESEEEEREVVRRACVWGRERVGASSQSSQEGEQGCVWSGGREEAGGLELGASSGEREELHVDDLEPPAEEVEPSGEDVEPSAEDVEPAVENVEYSGEINIEPSDEIVENPIGLRELPAGARSRKRKSKTVARGAAVPQKLQVVELRKEDKEETVQDTVEPGRSTGSSVASQEAEDSLSSLTGLIPAHELEEMLGSEDFLFCGEPSKRSEARPKKAARESSSRSVRRSARLSLHPSASSLVGSIFEEEEEGGAGKGGGANVAAAEDEVFVSVGEPRLVDGAQEEPRLVDGVQEEPRLMDCGLEEPRLAAPVLEELGGSFSTPSGPGKKEEGTRFFNKLVPLKKASKSRMKSRVKRRSGDKVLQDISNLDRSTAGETAFLNKDDHSLKKDDHSLKKDDHSFKKDDHMLKEDDHMLKKGRSLERSGGEQKGKRSGSGDGSRRSR